MAKLIERGVYRYRHKSCRSLIEFSKEELLEDYSTDYTGDRDYFRWVLCPGCNQRIIFPQYGSIEDLVQ